MNHALRIHACGGPDGLKIDDIAMPTAHSRQVIVRVRAAGINAIDWKIRDGWLQNDFPLPLPTTRFDMQRDSSCGQKSGTAFQL